MRALTLFPLLSLLAACGSIDAYEAAVGDWAPTYCYQTIGGATCFREPHHRDERRLVNYFGPHPSRFDKPEPPALAPVGAPEAVNYWVKDAEPIPRAAPTGPVAELAWLDPARNAEVRAKAEFARRDGDPRATRAFLARLGVGPDGHVQPLATSRPMTPMPGRPGRGVAAPQPAEAAAMSAKSPKPAVKAPGPPLIEVEVN